MAVMRHPNGARTETVQRLQEEHGRRRSRARRQLKNGLLVTSLYYLVILAALAGYGLLNGVIERMH